MYIFRMKSRTFAFPEDPDGTYKAALFAEAHRFACISLERDPPNKDFSEYNKYREKANLDARVVANKIITPKEAFYKHLYYDLIIEQAAEKLLKEKVDLEKYRVKDKYKTCEPDEGLDPDVIKAFNRLKKDIPHIRKKLLRELKN